MTDLKIPPVNALADDECRELSRKIARICSPYSLDDIRSPVMDYCLTLDQAVAMLNKLGVSYWEDEGAWGIQNYRSPTTLWKFREFAKPHDLKSTLCVLLKAFEARKEKE